MAKRPPATPPDPGRAARRLAGVFKALEDPTRVAVLFLLADRGEASVAEVMAATGQAQSATSFHLAKLQAAGLVEYRKDGKFHRYRLNPDGLRDVPGLLAPAGRSATITLGGIEVRIRPG